MIEAHRHSSLIARLYKALKFEYKDNGDCHYKHLSSLLLWNPRMTGRWYTSSRALFSDLISRCNAMVAVGVGGSGGGVAAAAAARAGKGRAKNKNQNENSTTHGGRGNEHRSATFLWSAKTLKEQRETRAERRAMRRQIRDTEAYYFGASAVPVVEAALQAAERAEADVRGGESYGDYDERRGIVAAPTFAPAALLKDPQRFGLLGRELNVATGLLRKINKHPRRDALLELVGELCFEYRWDGGGGSASGASGQHAHRTPKVRLVL